MEGTDVVLDTIKRCARLLQSLEHHYHLPACAGLLRDVGQLYNGIQQLEPILAAATAAGAVAVGRGRKGRLVETPTPSRMSMVDLAFSGIARCTLSLQRLLTHYASRACIRGDTTQLYNVLQMLEPILDSAMECVPKSTRKKRKVLKTIQASQTLKGTSVTREVKTLRTQRKMQDQGRWLLPQPAKLFREPGCGYGLKSCKLYNNKFAITCYSGSIHDKSEFADCPAKCKTHLLGLGDGTNRVCSGLKDPIDAMQQDSSSLGSFINHPPEGKEANCSLLVISDEANMDNPTIVVVSIGTILPGDTLWLDYGTHAFDAHHTQVDHSALCARHDI
jgi:hypothetical protein